MSTDRKQKQVEELAALIHKAIVGGDESTCDRTTGPCWAAARAMAAQGWVSPEQHQKTEDFSRGQLADHQRLMAKVKRVEALAEGPTRTDVGGYQPYAVELPSGIHLAVLLDDLRAALSEPERDQEGPAYPLPVLCNSCGRALANVGEWCCNRFTTTADVTTVERDHVAEATEVRKQRKG